MCKRRTNFRERMRRGLNCEKGKDKVEKETEGMERGGGGDEVEDEEDDE